MSAMRFWAQGRGKNRENMNKKEKGWKSPLSFLLGQTQNIADYFLFSQSKNIYLYANFVIFSRKYELYIVFWFLFYIFAAEFLFKQGQL